MKPAGKSTPGGIGRSAIGRDAAGESDDSTARDSIGGDGRDGRDRVTKSSPSRDGSRRRGEEGDVSAVGSAKIASSEVDRIDRDQGRGDGERAPVAKHAAQANGTDSANKDGTRSASDDHRAPRANGRDANGVGARSATEDTGRARVLDSAEHDLDSAAHDLDVATRDLDSATQDLDSAGHDQASVERDLDSATHDLDSAERAVDSAEHELDSAEHELDSAQIEHDHRARDLAAIVVERISAGKPVRRTLEGGGRLHVDRALPFLCVYRPRGESVDVVVRDFVRTQAAYLVAPIGRDVSAFVDAVVDGLAKKCGACLLLELWAGDEPAGPFRIHAHERTRLATTIDALADALREMRVAGAFDVSVALEGTELVEIVEDAPSPPGEKPLVDPARAAKEGVLAIGLEVPPRYRPAGQAPVTVIYPFVAQAMARELAHALQRGFYEFARVQTPTHPAHFHAMGRRHLVRAVREADHALAEISSTFDFLLAVTPVNTEAAWKEFCAKGKREQPVLRYRMLEVDPAIGKRQLYDLPLDRLEDPVLAQLLHDKRRELDRQLGLLEDRDTPAFVHGSVQLYGAVSDALLAEAEAILARPVPPKRDEGRVGSAAVVERARAEIARYRVACPALTSRVELRDDIAALMVSHGDVLVPVKLEVSSRRLEALMQHEVGTHVVTYANGFAQPLRVLAAGLAGYESLQEGLALTAEFVAGGFDAERLRLIAARAVAVRRLVEGVGFVKVVEELEGHGLTARGAFATTVRVFRGGGLTKDAIYLRGLLDVLAYLRAGRDLAPLLVGKVAFDQVPFIEELLRRDVLRAPVLRPHWLDGEGSPARIAKLRSGLTPLELLEDV